MIDTFQIATQGIGPGWSTFNFATQGFGFDVEVIIRPTQGGGGSGVWAPVQEYEIIVRVRYKGKLWEEQRTITGLMAQSLEKVLATFKTMKTNTIQILAHINNTIRTKIEVFARRKEQ